MLLVPSLFFDQSVQNDADNAHDERAQECGPEVVVSNMGVYRFDENGIMYLASNHPGVSVEQVADNCGFKLNVDRLQGETPAPTYKELFVLREFVDPELIFLPQKMEYPPAIQSLIDS